MWQGRVKLIIGVWLIISGLVLSLQSPWNLLITGFIIAICCFKSYKLWEASVTGILGLWLFISGLSTLLMGGHALVSSWNFLITGLLIAIIGIRLLVKPPSEPETPKL
ncbi:MAG: hypothetical protein EH225_00570 [Calditrichaeota bacterium]|nr:hypothetical protein [Calditrichota bacterium]RQW08175.1 MAG: hypothetical protein EH225_00570 [Calditrichota bacterium]